jgi:hypothetical protein
MASIITATTTGGLTQSADNSGVLQLASGAGNLVTVPSVTGTMITTASSSQSIPKAALPTGSVLQVVQTIKTDKFTTTSSSAVDITGLSATITPTSASSKILILTDINYGGEDNLYGALYVLRNSTNVIVSTYPTGNQIAATFGVGPPRDSFKIASASHIYLDSPNTTSAITYKVQAASTYNSVQLTINAPFQTTNAAYIIGGTSSITVMEIAA